MTDVKREELIFSDKAQGSEPDAIQADNSTPFKAILGTLEGPCADFINSTRNGRKYTESLWEKVFADPIVNEMIENGGIPGELDHPVDREETDSSRIAIIMNEKPYKKNGKLWAKFNILNTPLGKIAYTLAKAGFNLGVSSRGSGDVFTNSEGLEEVDSDSYDFKAFDLVLLPAVKEARLKMVEGLNRNKFDYKKALVESIKNSSKEDKKIMVDCLRNLHIDYTGKQSNSFDNIYENLKEESVANSKDTLMEDFQALIRENTELARTITSLQEKLSVGYSKEAQLVEKVNMCEDSIRKLSIDAKKVNALSSKISILEEQLKSYEDKVGTLTEQLDERTNKLRDLSKSYNKVKNDRKSLNDGLDTKSNQISLLKEDINKLNKGHQLTEAKLNNRIKELEESLKTKETEYSNKISNSNKMVENYKAITNKAVDKYIESLARGLGASVSEIKEKLPKNYSFNDIDEVCESYRNFKLRTNNLPFSTLTESGNKNVSMTAKESKKEYIIPASVFDDSIDSSLLNMAGM